MSIRLHVIERPLTLLGAGSALPGPPVSTSELLDRLAERCGPGAARRARRIAGRLGIERRHVSRDLGDEYGGTRPGRDAPALCGDALLQAFAEAGIDARSLDYLMGHTTSPHTLLPANIAWVAERLEYDGPFFELRQACTGFAAGLQAAAAMIHAGQVERAAIVGSETGSSYFRLSRDFVTTEQLVNYVQMGDGAGAVVVGPDDGSGRSRITEVFYGHNGRGKRPGIALEGGGSADPAAGPGLPWFRHDAAAVRRHGAELILDTARALAERGLPLADFDWILPHQVNGRLARQVADAVDVSAEQVYVSADELGNLGSAAIWVSLDRLRRSGRLEQGHRVLVLGAEASKYLTGGFVYTH